MKLVRGNSRGDVLINLIAAAAILAAVTVGLMTLMSNMFKGSKRLGGKIDVDQLRLFVTGMIACDKTIPPPPAGCAPPGPCPCTPDASGFKTAKDAFGNTVISGDPATPTRVGLFTLRAECAGDAILVRATILANGGTLNSTLPAEFGPHPSTNKPVLWSDTKSLLFPAGATLCRSGNIESRVSVVENNVSVLQAQVQDLRNWKTIAEQQLADYGAKFGNLLSNTCANVPVRAIGGFESNGAQKCKNPAHDFNGDGYDDVVIGALAGGGPRVRVISGTEQPSGTAIIPNSMVDFFAYDLAWTGGVGVGMGDIDGDGYSDLITAAGPGGGSHIKVFKGNSGNPPAMIRNYFGLELAWTGGISVGP